MILDAFTLANSLREKLRESSDQLSAFWICVPGDRSDLANALSHELAEDGGVCLVARGNLFNNPNDILGDFVRLLEDNRDAISHSVPSERCERAGRFFVVVLGLTPLFLPQVSSPVLMPGWCPLLGGRTTTVLIKDVTGRLDGPMGMEVAQIGDLSLCLFDIERALVDRLEVVRQRSHNAANHFFDLIKTADCDGDSFIGLLNAARAHLDGIKSRTGYRPSMRDSGSVLGRVWRFINESPPKSWTKAGAAFADALELPLRLPDYYESFAGVLLRPGGQDHDMRRRFGRNVLICMYQGCQFTTAAAHADDYGKVSISLQAAYSLDLRRSLRSAEEAIAKLD